MLCIPTNIIKEKFNINDNFLKCSKESLNSLPYTFLPRQEAENDFSYKQVIPYVLVFNAEGEILFYQRCGSEKRLTGLFSAGIGGHVNDDDENKTVYDTILSGVRREIKEELGLDITNERLQLLGMINEEQTNVGHCHIGVVFKLTIENEGITFEQEIGNPRWEYPNKLDLSRFEIWSSLAIELDKF